MDELNPTRPKTILPVEDIVMHEFVSSDGLTIYGHLSVPPGPGPHPAVVVCTVGTGGAEDTEARSVRMPEHGPLHAHGFAVFTVDQRGASGPGVDYAERAETGDRDIDDVLAAARYLVERSEIDAAQLNVIGTSRRGYSALLALTRDPDRWHRAVLITGLSGPDPLATVERSTPGALMPQRARSEWSQIEAHFGPPARGALTALAAVKAPLLIVHGDSDQVVSVEQAVQLAGRAHQLGRSARLVVVPGPGRHNYRADQVWADLWPTIGHFLREKA